MDYNPINDIKDLIRFHLSQIDNEPFRFMLFFKLSDKQVFLLNIFESGKDFLKIYKGLQLSLEKNFSDILSSKKEYESKSPIETNYPFLYGEFINNSTLYVKQICFSFQCLGFFEFVIKKDYISQYTKNTLNELAESIKPYLVDLYIEIRKDISKRYYAVNALNVIKNARPRTFYHSFRVADLSVAIAQKMGLSKSVQRNICYASFIHDLGEMYLPRDIFYKEGSLSKEEMDMVKKHPEFLKVIFSNNPITEDIVNIAYYHHERVDGRGYYGFSSNDIPIESKILALSEVVDGLYTDRPGRKGFDIHYIMSAIEHSCGKSFDCSVVDAALVTIKKYYLDREYEFLNSNHISNVGKPVVVVFQKGESIELIQGVIEYIGNNIAGIKFYDTTSCDIKVDSVVRVQFSFFDIIYDFESVVISSTDESVNVLIKNTSSEMLGNLNVFWEFDMIAVPLKLSGTILNSKESNKTYLKLKTKRFGSKSLSAKAENPSFDLNIGDTVLIKMKPLKELISIPAVVSNIIKEDNSITAYFEYFSLPEKMDALIHQAIYHKQSQASL